MGSLSAEGSLFRWGLYPGVSVWGGGDFMISFQGGSLSGNVSGMHSCMSSIGRHAATDMGDPHKIVLPT